MPQVSTTPADRLSHPLSPPAVGERYLRYLLSLAPSVPRPRSPEELSPQQKRAFPAPFRAQVCMSPAVTMTQSASFPTWVGTDRLFLSPSPSWPSLLSPQHHRVPMPAPALPSRMPQV